MKRHLRTSVYITCTVFAVLIVLGIGTVGYFTYSNAMIEQCQQYIDGILNVTKTQIDADDLERCFQTGTISEQYEKSRKFLDKCKLIYNIEYIYIVKPLNDSAFDNMRYMMIGITEEEIKRGIKVDLGKYTADEYSPEVARFYLDAMDNGKNISYYANTTSFGYMYTGLVPLVNSRGESVGILSVDISMNDIYRTRLHYVLIVVAGGVILLLLFLAGISGWLRNRVTDPIADLEQAAKKYVTDSRGNNDPDTLVFDAKEIHTGDEIESLSNSLVNMSQDLKTYMNNLMIETREKQRIASELSVASDIQANMLPRIFPAFPDIKEMDIFASMTPAKEVGGDLYDFFMVDESHVCVVIADVSGKGVPAALFMVIAKTLIKNQMQAGGSVNEMLSIVNNQLAYNNDDSFFVTTWAAIIDLKTGDAEFCDAGHETALLIHSDGTVDEIRPRKKHPPLATMEGLKFTKNNFTLKPGDKLFIYTDGVPEATNADDAMYGMERLKTVLSQHAGDTPQGLLMSVKADVDAFVGDAPQFDDLTMLGLIYNG